MEATDWNFNTQSIRVAAYPCTPETRQLLQAFGPQLQLATAGSLQELEEYLLNQSLISLPEVVVIEMNTTEPCVALVKKIQDNMLLKGLIIILLSDKEQDMAVAKTLKVHDFYMTPCKPEDILNRIAFLVKFKLIKPNLMELSDNVDLSYRMPVAKRIFDVLFSGTLLLLFSPMFLIIAILIRLESKGAVIYKSKRVGTGYKVFDFYKFRSMRPDADKNLAALSSQFNQYAAEGEGKKSTFVKLKNDPRITRVGRFIRRTSIDELPQLFNIFKGDMSTVGNRPLPLYEAEQLTSNEWSWRFLAPAGLTGLWQISRRGKEDMSERERKKLDNFYAQKHSIWFDLKILLRTLPAAYQKENV